MHPVPRPHQPRVRLALAPSVAAHRPRLEHEPRAAAPAVAVDDERPRGVLGQQRVDRIDRIAGVFARDGIALGFETGQETAETLAAFLRMLGRKDVGVNFDPANMILYDKGEPLAALRTLGPWIRHCHLKDARRTRVPGAWGEEVAVGAGEVDWTAFLGTLDGLGFKGDLCIEREAGTQRAADIRAGRLHLESLVR